MLVRGVGRGPKVPTKPKGGTSPLFGFVHGHISAECSRDTVGRTVTRILRDCSTDRKETAGKRRRLYSEHRWAAFPSAGCTSVTSCGDTNDTARESKVADKSIIPDQIGMCASRAVFRD